MLSLKLNHTSFTNTAILKWMTFLWECSPHNVDDIHTKALQMAVIKLAKPLSTFFPKRHSKMLVPKRWKREIITWVRENKSRADVVNFRSINLLPFITMLIEFIVSEANMLYLVSSQMLAPEQHELHQNSSGFTNIMFARACRTEPEDFVVEVYPAWPGISRAFH